MEEPQNKFRYERKFTIPKVYLNQFYSELILNNFLILHDSRYVNNLYFDDYNFSSVSDNIEGLSCRKKYRVRWYGKTYKKSDKFLEIKFKNEFLNKKEKLDLGIIPFESNKSIDKFAITITNKLLEQNSLNLYLEIKKRIPTLLNSYKREYFYNSSEQIRITIDDNLNFFSPVTKQKFIENKIIIEAKYDRESNFFNKFNKLTTTRYSKYVKGTIQTSNFTPIY